MNIIAPVELAVIWNDYCTLDKLIIWTLAPVESVYGTIIVL